MLPPVSLDFPTLAIDTSIRNSFNRLGHFQQGQGQEDYESLISTSVLRLHSVFLLKPYSWHSWGTPGGNFGSEDVYKVWPFLFNSSCVFLCHRVIYVLISQLSSRFLLKLLLNPALWPTYLGLDTLFQSLFYGLDSVLLNPISFPGFCSTLGRIYNIIVGFKQPWHPQLSRNTSQFILGTPYIKLEFSSLSDGSCDRATDHHPGEFISFTTVLFSHRFPFAVFTGYYLSDSISSLLSSDVESPIVQALGRNSLILGRQVRALAQMDETWLPYKGYVPLLPLASVPADDLQPISRLPDQKALASFGIPLYLLILPPSSCLEFYIIWGSSSYPAKPSVDESHCFLSRKKKVQCPKAVPSNCVSLGLPTSRLTIRKLNSFMFRLGSLQFRLFSDKREGLWRRGSCLPLKKCSNRKSAGSREVGTPYRHLGVWGSFLSSPRKKKGLAMWLTLSYGGNSVPLWWPTACKSSSWKNCSGRDRTCQDFSDPFTVTFCGYILLCQETPDKRFQGLSKNHMNLLSVR